MAHDKSRKPKWATLAAMIAASVPAAPIAWSGEAPGFHNFAIAATNAA